MGTQGVQHMLIPWIVLVAWMTCIGHIIQGYGGRRKVAQGQYHFVAIYTFHIIALNVKPLLIPGYAMNIYLVCVTQRHMVFAQFMLPAGAGIFSKNGAGYKIRAFVGVAFLQEPVLKVLRLFIKEAHAGYRNIQDMLIKWGGISYPFCEVKTVVKKMDVQGFRPA